jgi:hypothetical protein
MTTATITVRETIQRISTILQDISPQFQRWPETELVNWLNDAHTAITKFLPSANSRIDAIKLQPGTMQSIEAIPAANCKPGDGSVPSVPINGISLLDVICNMGADGATPGKAIRLVDRKTMDGQNPMWHTQTGTVINSFLYDPETPRYFYVTPGVQGGQNVWVRAAYTAQPIKIPNTGSPGSELYLATGTNNTLISISDEYIDDLVNYVVARANMKDAEFADGNKAQVFSGLFLASLNSKVTALTGNNPNLTRLPFAPAPIAAAR